MPTKTHAARRPRACNPKVRRTLVAALRRAEKRADKPAADRIKLILNGEIATPGA
jgi:hypothetical protein